ncbi:MAG: VWA domain-containing protein [Candidatus Lokiarchaeota archaeon]|nr:VWA domain-containing protein [Candidatus Lokiarchaeota archaeon]
MSQTKLEDTVILIDVSRSMARKDFYPSRIEVIKKAFKYFVTQKSEIDSNDRFSIITFSNEAKTLLEYTESVNDVIEIIDSVRISGTTGLGEGIAAAIQIVTKEIRGLGEKLHRIVIISDGRPWGSTIDPIKMSKVAAKLGVHIDCIGVSELGVSVHDSILEKIASNTNGKYIRIFDTKSLMDAISEIAAKKEIAYSDSKKRTTDAALLETIAVDLFLPSETEEAQDRYVALLTGKAKDKCIICFQDICPICKGPFFTCGRFCPNCKSPMHLHCSVEWAEASKAATGSDVLFRCPRCYFLLRVPQRLKKLKEIKGTRPRSLAYEEDVPTAKFVRVEEESEELYNSVCPICHIIFDGPPAYLCMSCATYYHEICLDKWLEQKEGACRICGKKIVL